MADTKMGNFSQSSSASPTAPAVNTNNPEGGFLSSTMDFINKHKMIIIGIIVLIIVGFIAYKYFGTERFTGASKKSKGKNKALKQMSEEESESEHFSDYQDEEQDQDVQDQDVQEQYTQEQYTQDEEEQEQEQEQEINEDFDEVNEDFDQEDEVEEADE